MKKLITVSLVMIFLFLHLGSIEAENWREKYPIVTFGVRAQSDEAIARFNHIVDYLSERTGVNVVLRTSPDYAPVIDEIAAGEIQFIEFGPLPYATTYDKMQGDIEPLVMAETKSGQRGYHIIMVVKGDSGYATLDDLKGKILAVPDPNSTASYTLPKSYMDPDKPFFSSYKVSGSHGKGVKGVIEGTFDCAVTWAYSEKSGQIPSMMKKGQIKNGDVKIIWWSSLVPNHCVAAAGSLPREMKQTFEKALIEFAEKDPKRFSQHNPRLSRYVAADHEDYRITFEILENKNKASRLVQK